MPTIAQKKSAAAHGQKIDPLSDFLQFKKGALVLRAINHKLRQDMLKLIAKNGELSVTEIYVALRLEQSVASQHLAILRAARFVNTRRDGKKIYYSVNRERLAEVHELAKALVNGSSN